MQDNVHDTDISEKILDSVRELTPRQREYVLAYCDKDSPTYGNKSASYNRAYHNQIDGTYPEHVPKSTIHTYASQLSKVPTVHSAIEKVLDSLQYGYTVRLSTLAQIGSGKYVSRSTSRQYDKDGNLIYTSETTSTPKPGDAIKAIDTINKMTGAYTQAELASKRQDKRIDDIYKRMSQQVNKYRDVTGTGEGD